MRLSLDEMCRVLFDKSYTQMYCEYLTDTHAVCIGKLQNDVAPVKEMYDRRTACLAEVLRGIGGRKIGLDDITEYSSLYFWCTAMDTLMSCNLRGVLKEYEQKHGAERKGLTRTELSHWHKNFVVCVKPALKSALADFTS